MRRGGLPADFWNLPTRRTIPSARAVGVQLKDCPRSVTAWQSVADLAAKVYRDPRAPAQRGATAEELASLELRLGLSLPASLTTWLGVLNGDTVGQGGVFGARRDKSFLDIAHISKIFQVEWAGHLWIPVASDGCGNYYVLLPDERVGFVDTMADPRAIDAIKAETLDEFLLWYLLQK